MSNLVMSRGCCGDHRRCCAVVCSSSWGKSWCASGFLAQLDRARQRKTQEWLEAKKPHPHVELGHAAPMPSLEGACQEEFSVVIPAVSLHA